MLLIVDFFVEHLIRVLLNSKTALLGFLFFICFIAYFVGFLSDFFMALTLEMVDLTGHLTPSNCLSDVNSYDESQKYLCAAAYATGLQRAMSATVCLFTIAAFCFAVSSKNLERDLVADL